MGSDSSTPFIRSAAPATAEDDEAGPVPERDMAQMGVGKGSPVTDCKPARLAIDVDAQVGDQGSDKEMVTEKGDGDATGDSPSYWQKAVNSTTSASTAGEPVAAGETETAVEVVDLVADEDEAVAGAAAPGPGKVDKEKVKKTRAKRQKPPTTAAAPAKRARGAKAVVAAAEASTEEVPEESEEKSPDATTTTTTEDDPNDAAPDAPTTTDEPAQKSAEKSEPKGKGKRKASIGASLATAAVAMAEAAEEAVLPAEIAKRVQVNKECMEAAAAELTLLEG